MRSFVLRQGRMTPAQQRAFVELYPRYGIDYAPQLLDLRHVFGRDAPRVIEIGSGMGETTLAIARERPDTDFLAVEVHLPGVGALLHGIEKHALANLRVMRHDAIEVLACMIGDATLAGVHLFFPDPWPKKRHHKRRIVQPAFAALVTRKLAPGGILHAATDWAEYATWIAGVLDATEGLVALPPGRGDRPPTKFEARGIALGHAVSDLRYRRAC